MKAVILPWLQGLLNQRLQASQDAQDHLRSLIGKTLVIQLQGLSLAIALAFREQEIVILGDGHAKPDCLITAGPFALGELALSQGEELRALFAERVQIEGDIFLAERLKPLFESLLPDWESILRPWIGDAMANALASQFNWGFEKLKAFTGQFGQSLQRGLGEYLQEEIRLSPSALELADFMSDVDQLNLDCERLEASLIRIEAQHEKN